MNLGDIVSFVPGLVKYSVINKLKEGDSLASVNIFSPILNPGKKISYCEEILSSFEEGDPLKWLYNMNPIRCASP